MRADAGLLAMAIYEDLIAAGVPTDHHESDLYALVTPESRALVAAYEYRCHVQTFVSQVDGRLWYDIPFAYQPFWDRVRQREVRS